MINRKTFLIGLGVYLSSVSACMNQETNVAFKVSVKNNQGSPLDKAEVYINDQKEGITNKDGILQLKIDLPAGKRASIEVKKSSDRYYFAPWFEQILVSDADNQSVTLNATLYFVPKPTAEDVARIEKATRRQANKESKAAAPPPAEGKSGGSDVAEGTAADQGKNKAAPGVDSPPAPSPPQPAPPLASTAAPQPLEQADKPADPGNIPGKTPLVLNTPDTRSGPSPAPPVNPGKPKQQGPLLFNIHVFSGKKPLKGAIVSRGEAQSPHLREACKTNKRGRCVIRFKTRPQHSQTFVVRLPGYQTKTLSTRVVHKGRLRFRLAKGQSIDVFTLTRSFGYTRGLERVAVFMDGKRVGQTNKFGHFSWFFKGKKGSLLPVSLRAEGYLPDTYTEDFIVSGPMSLTRYFTPLHPGNVRLALLPVRPAGSIQPVTREAFNGATDRLIHKAARSSLLQSRVFKEIVPSAFRKALARTGLAVATIEKRGWNGTELKGELDTIIRPTLVMGDPMILELAAIDSRGRVLVAAKEKISSPTDADAISRAMGQITAKLTRHFPFEGAVIAKKGDDIIINLGFSSGRGMKVGRLMDVYGTQSDRLGQKKTYKKIGLLKTVKVNENNAMAVVVRLKPRALVSIGDQVVLRGYRTPGGRSVTFAVSGKGKTTAQAKPIKGANIYLNDRWIGASDKNGRLSVAKTLLGQGGIIRVIKSGHHQYTREWQPGGPASVRIPLKKEIAFLRIDSEPPGALIRLDQKLVGRTPLSTPVAVPTGFIRLEVKGGAGYKTFSTILDMDEGTLDLTGPRKIQLEKDLIAMAHRLLDKGKIQDALQRLKQVGPKHSDYLLACHEAGEIYLTMENRPAKAAEAFGKVTSSKSVASFNDKRFIGSHINEGIAIFLTAEQLAGANPELAKAHYAKATEILERVRPQLRFVPENQHARAVHNVSFHAALARHRLWNLTKNPALLTATLQSWRTYLEGNAVSTPLPEGGKSYVENARIYFKQARSYQSAQDAKHRGEAL